MNTKLYMELLKTRNNIRAKYASGGRTPNVCSDDSIYEMARLVPKSKEEFLNIKGLGQSFVDKYGNAFMKVINKYSETVATSVLSKDIKSTLKNLESRLVNISKSNRLLYLGKIYPKYAFDLYFPENNEFNAKLGSLIKNRSLTIASLSVADRFKKEHAERYKRLTALIREVNKDFRESGEYDLFLGYPFVVGKTKFENFKVCAPLMLFPVAINKDAERISIKIDQSKDILYNNNLVLLHNKFSNINKELPNNVIEDLTENFVADASAFFKENGLNVPKTLPELSAYPEYNAETFPEFASGEFKLINSYVLGKFSLYESSIQRDFKAISNKPTISSLLSDLLKNANEIDIYSDSEKPANLSAEFSESSINYINELNISQENAIRAIENQNELVIQGPPGTGKSQTITSLIADCVCKGKNVLMVSQKKAALDVIYSRLGSCANQTLMLYDTKDKDNFYLSLDRTYGFSKIQNYNSGEFYELSRLVDRDIEKLQAIANALYVTEQNGTKMYKIYQENPNNAFKTDESLSIRTFYSVVSKNLLLTPYEKIKQTKLSFDDNNYLDNCLKYLHLMREMPWLEGIKETLSIVEKHQMKDDFAFFNTQIAEFHKKNWFVRLFVANKYKLLLRKLVKKYFSSKKHFKSMFKNGEKLASSLDMLPLFCELKPIYSTLSDLQKEYLLAVDNLCFETNSTAVEANNNLYDYLILTIIDQFEVANRTTLNDIKNYNFIVSEVAKCISEKKDITRQKLKRSLEEAVWQFVQNSKRFQEIRRISESKRKWSVNKFIKKFGFELFRGIKIWLMTPETVSEVLPLEDGLFDVVVFDEASQIYIEKGVPAIARAKKVVISGDHKQLRPSSLGFGRTTYEENDEDEDELQTNAALEEESLLDLARFKYPQVMLNYHYRAKYSELINFSNYAFYRGQLNVAPNLENSTTPPIEYIKIDNGLWQNRANKQEAKKVVEIVKNLLSTRQNNETLGVITFNSAQRDLILDYLDDESAKDSDFAAKLLKETNRRENGEDIGFFVKNIENVQGDERDIIIFSLSYAKNEQGKVVRNFGWLNQVGGENRLNVAISRAKQKIYIISSLEPNELVTSDLKNDGPKLFRKYLEYAEAISKGNKKLTASILSGFIAESKPITDSEIKNPLTESIERALLELGVKTVRNVGIGNYKFDLAVLSFETNKFVLGIKCDGESYGENCLARERDISSAAYYKARGWKAYRVWPNEWWHNSEKVIAEIQELIK